MLLLAAFVIPTTTSSVRSCITKNQKVISFAVNNQQKKSYNHASFFDITNQPADITCKTSSWMAEKHDKANEAILEMRSRI